MTMDLSWTHWVNWISWIDWTQVYTLRRALRWVVPVLLGSGLLFWLVSLTCKPAKSVAQNAALVTFSTLLGCLLANGMAGYWLPPVDANQALLNALGIIRLWHPQAVIRTGPRASFFKASHTTKFLGGVPNALTLLCIQPRHSWVTYRSDRFGLRNPDTVWNNPAVDVLLIGDSFAQGYCLKDQDTLDARLRDRGFSTINLGYTANGPLIELATLQEALTVVKPKTVFWLYFEGNDLRFPYQPKDRQDDGDFDRELKNPHLAPYWQPNHTVHYFDSPRLSSRYTVALFNKSSLRQRARKNPGPSWSKQLADTASNYWQLRHINRFLRFSHRPAQMPYTPIPKARKRFLLKQFRRVLTQANTLTKQSGSRLVLVYVTGETTLYYREPHPLYQNVLRIADDLDIPVIDLYKDWLDDPQYAQYFEDHWSAKGTAVLSRKMVLHITPPP
ncbi:MAG: hypothetical protein KC475_07720 [Cyanobacteria bacterium HKST-UBA03]|nr:hypothetical protein [Cyanobacteria bacterium HKST-UBA03]